MAGYEVFGDHHELSTIADLEKERMNVVQSTHSPTITTNLYNNSIESQVKGLHNECLSTRSEVLWTSGFMLLDLVSII